MRSTNERSRKRPAYGRTPTIGLQQPATNFASHLGNPRLCSQIDTLNNLSTFGDVLQTYFEIKLASCGVLQPNRHLRLSGLDWSRRYGFTDLEASLHLNSLTFWEWIRSFRASRELWRAGLTVPDGRGGERSVGKFEFLSQPTFFEAETSTLDEHLKKRRNIQCILEILEKEYHVRISVALSHPDTTVGVLRQTLSAGFMDVFMRNLASTDDDITRAFFQKLCDNFIDIPPIQRVVRAILDANVYPNKCESWLTVLMPALDECLVLDEASNIALVEARIRDQELQERNSHKQLAYIQASKRYWLQRRVDGALFVTEPQHMGGVAYKLFILASGKHFIDIDVERDFIHRAMGIEFRKTDKRLGSFTFWDLYQSTIQRRFRNSIASIPENGVLGTDDAKRAEEYERANSERRSLLSRIDIDYASCIDISKWSSPGSKTSSGHSIGSTTISNDSTIFDNINSSIQEHFTKTAPRSDASKVPEGDSETAIDELCDKIGSIIDNHSKALPSCSSPTTAAATTTTGL